MADIKHVGRLKTNQRKVVVAYKVIPKEDPAVSALVIDTATLDDADHDALINTVEGNAGQSAFEFAEVMARSTLPDGANMLAKFHATGKLVKVPHTSIEMMPNPNTTIGLDELVKITKTKFIIITHHALTMSRMDRLYGVTMAEQGVSQLVSVDLQRAEELVA